MFVAFTQILTSVKKTVVIGYWQEWPCGKWILTHRSKRHASVTGQTCNVYQEIVLFL